MPVLDRKELERIAGYAAEEALVVATGGLVVLLAFAVPAVAYLLGVALSPMTGWRSRGLSAASRATK